MLESLNAVELAEILQRALAHENLEAMDEGAQLSVINASGGDARRLISPLIGV
jgi:replication-associated recombination protein RarA